MKSILTILLVAALGLLSGCASIQNGDSAARVAFTAAGAYYVEQQPVEKRAEVLRELIEFIDDVQIWYEFNELSLEQIYDRALNRIATSDMPVSQKILANELVLVTRQHIDQKVSAGELVSEDIQATLNNVFAWLKLGAMMGASN